MIDAVAGYPVHPAAALLPRMSKSDFQELKRSIREDGQRHPIILYRGEILDGVHRALACVEIGLEPKVEEYDGSDPYTYTIVANFSRRHMTASQRAMFLTDVMPEIERELRKESRSAKVTGAERLRKRRAEPQAQRIRDRIGRMGRVSGRSLQRAKRLKVAGDAELAEKVATGQMSLSGAEKVLEEREQEKKPQTRRKLIKCAFCAGTGRVSVDREGDIPQYQLPEGLDTPGFQRAWDTWLRYRREIGKKMTPMTVHRQMLSFLEMGPARAAQSIMRSIEKGWTGIFEPGTRGRQEGPKAPATSSVPSDLMEDFDVEDPDA